MYKILFTLFALIISITVFGQKTELEVRKMAATYSEQELVFESSTLMYYNQLFLAEILVDKLLQFQPESSNYNYKKGYILLYSKMDYEKAKPYLHKAILSTSENYDLYSLHEKTASIDAFYHLGKCYHLGSEFDKAKQYFNQFLILTNTKSDLIYKAHTSILQCDVAKSMMARPKKVIVKNIGKVINTEYPEYSPVVSLDGSAIYFTSRRPWENDESEMFRDASSNDYPEDIYVSFSDEKGNWAAPKKMDFCEAQRNEATVAVSSDEKRIYVYQDNSGAGDLFFSDFKSNAFTEIKKIEYNGVNTENWETHCTMTTDGLNMYFVSDRPGGLGGRDIYRVVKMPDGTWSLPQNLGSNINTSSDEDSPFIASDNKTLYYSSNGPKSMGGFDIFVTIRDEDNVWANPMNMGYPINSPGDDLFYTTTIDGLKGYMTSFRKNGLGEKDIYEIQNDYVGLNNIASLKGHIKTVNGEPIPSDLKITVSCLNCQESLVNSTSPRLRDGTFFSALLEHCRDYEYIITHGDSGTEVFRETVTTKCESKYHEIFREIVLDTKTMKVLSALDPSENSIASSANGNKENEFGLKETGVKEIERKDVIDANTLIKDFEMIHYFGYNGNVLSVNSGDLKIFLKEIETQLKESNRKNLTIVIESSASNVPTSTFKNNETLAEIRALNIQKELMTYIANRKEFKNKVKVEIKQTRVDGPEYENDASNRKKYQKFQFIYLKTK
jgi:tetratricopeptide (TPR) repeat protein